MDDDNVKGLSLCDSCYQAADQEQAATSDSCDVCTYRSKLAEFRNLLSAKDNRIEELEAQTDKLKQQLKDSESQLLDGIGVVDKGNNTCNSTANSTGNSTGNTATGDSTGNNSGDVGLAKPRIEEAPPPDSRSHVMLVGDNLFGKLRKAPHFIYEHLGRIPRLVSRTKPDAGVLEMTRNAIDSLSNEKVPERNFHILWFGGLHDTTLEDYERKTFLDRLVTSLTDLKNHERVLSVNWCTLPESAHNAEAREINEYVAAWINERDSEPKSVDEVEGGAIRLVDLRYISRREGTMELNEAMWTPKGSKLVSESLRKFLNEKLEFTQKELEGIEASSRTMLEAREKKERNKNERKAKHEANLQEQQLRKQQKLAKQALLKAGHSIPGAGSKSTPTKNGSAANGKQQPQLQPPPPHQQPQQQQQQQQQRTPAALCDKPSPRNHPRVKKNKGASAMFGKRKSAFADPFSAPNRAFPNDYPPSNSEAFPARDNRSDSYFDGWGTKRCRVSSDDTPYSFASTSNPYYRREDYYRRSPPVSNSSPYDNTNRFLPSNGRNLCNVPDEQIRRLQWDAYDRLRP